MTNTTEPLVGVFNISPRELYERLKHNNPEPTIDQCYAALQAHDIQVEIVRYVLTGCGNNYIMQHMANNQLTALSPKCDNPDLEIDLIAIDTQTLIDFYNDTVNDLEDNDINEHNIDPALEMSENEATFLITHYGNDCVEWWVSDDIHSLATKLSDMRKNGYHNSKELTQ